MPYPFAVPRRASTVLVVRDGTAGLEVLMVRRSLQASFMPGAYVFPGGALDESDAEPDLLSRAGPLGPLAAAFVDADQAMAHAIAALRECFEECGLWLGAPGVPDVERMADARRRLRDGSAELAKLSVELGLPLAVDALAPWSHWVTPIDLPKRFDTRFYVCAAPTGQIPLHDAAETTTLEWVQPRAALDRSRDGSFPIEFATRTTLASLLPFSTVESLMRHARELRGLGAQHPRAGIGVGERREVVLPQHPAYAELMKLDPQGSGTGRTVIVPGASVSIGHQVRRLTAPNAGRMTGPGTNSYLFGVEGGDFVVLDPGPPLEAHVDALMAATGGRIRAVLVTHTHSDHSPAAALLAARTGATLVGLPAAPNAARHDRTFQPEVRPADGERFDFGVGPVLRAIHTPGHASNHVCWWYEEESMLFTGDHVMQGSTVVIDPPDGDMAAYLQSLHGLPRRLPTLSWLAPGHGFLIAEPVRAIERLIGHRLSREAKVVDAVRRLGSADDAALLPLVYDDVPPQLHPVAARSLLAHLLKLRDDGAVAQLDGRWSVV